MISQREARRLQKRVNELEAENSDRLCRWSLDWPGGVNICNAKFEAGSKVPVAITTARMLKHAVVVTTDDDGRVMFHALPLAD